MLTGRSRRILELTARVLPALLLIAVAANQLRLAHTSGLSPWSGGGFGMFAAADSPSHRHLHVALLGDDVRRDLFIPPSFEDRARRAATLPTRARLERLARALAAPELDGAIQWRAVTIEVWGVRYEPGSSVPTGRLVARERFALGGR